MASKMEAHERDHRVHIKVHEQKVQNLMYEHKMNITDISKTAEEAIGNENQHHDNMRKEIADITNDLKQSLRETQLSNEEHINMNKMSFTKNIDRLKAVFFFSNFFYFV